MGALATVFPWPREDDFLLKNAVEAGASLESLAKGAVKFSRRYSIREIQDRWRAVLYDGTVSTDSADSMRDYETRERPLPSRFYNFGHLKERRIVSVRRRGKSVRSSYYAMKKRLRRNSTAASMDFNFLVDPENGDYMLNENESEPPLPESCVPSNHFSDLDSAQCVFPENMIDGGDAINGDNAQVVYTGVDNPVEDGIPVEQKSILEEGLQILGDNVSLNVAAEELGVPDNLAVDNLIGDDNMPLSAMDHVDNDHENLCSEFDENKLFDSPELECGTSFNTLQLSPLPEMPEMPVWPTEESIPEAEFQYEGLNDPVLAELSNDPVLAELSNDLLVDFNEEELMNSLMEVDGNDGIDTSYYDDFSSLLRNSPIDVGPDQIPEQAETESLMDSHPQVTDHSVPCHAKGDDNLVVQSSSVQVVHKIEFQIPPSASAKDPHFPELINGVICCTLNTEDPEVPSNDDVFLPFDVPPSTFSCSHQSISREFSKSTSSTVRDYGFSNHRTSERGKSLMQVEQKNSKEPRASSQVTGSPSLPGPVCGSKAKRGFPHSHTSHTVSRSAVTVSGGFVGNNNAANTTNAPLHESKKDEPTNVALAKPLRNCVTNSLIEKPGVGSNDFRNHPRPNGSSMTQEQDVSLSLEDHQFQRAEMGSLGVLQSELVFSHPTIDEEEEYIDSDDDVPYYSDIEAMVLDMDFDPDDQDLYYNEEVSRYQHEETKQAIVRLEQGADAFMQRAIASHGAFAVLYSRRLKHYINKPEVLLGRATEGVPVDIDLSKEGYANTISRRQAIIKMNKDGSFFIKNLGKSSILVNDKEVHTGQCQRLQSSYVIELRGMSYTFETNQSCVKQYLDQMTDNLV